MGKKDNATGDGPVGGFDPEGDGSAPAFDIGFEPFYRSRLEPPVRAAQEFATQARGKLFEGLTRQLAESSVYGGEMAQRVAAQLAAPVQAAAEFHANAGSRIGSVLAQPVFDAAAWGEPWGAFPALEPGMIPPAKVLEAREMFGLRQLGIPPAPDGGQLVISPPTFDATWQEYRDQVLPLRGYDFDRYTLRLQELETRFPPLSSYRSEWQSRVAAAEADAPIGINPDAQAVTKPFMPAQPAPPAPAGGEPVPVSGGVVLKPPPRPIPPGMGGPPVASPVYPPGSTVPGSPGAFPDVPTVAPIGPDGCVYFAPERPIVIKGGQMEPRPAAHWMPLYYPPGWGIPGTPLYAGGYWWVYVNPICPETPPSPFPPTPTPGTGPSPPASGPAPCVAICGMDELIAALKGGADAAKCGKWKAWRDAQTGECYVQPSDKEPRSGLDEFILESSDAAALVAAVNEKCGQETKPPEKPSPPETPTGSTPVTGCDWILPVEIQNAIQIPNVVGWFLGAVDAQGKPIPPAPQEKAPWLFSWLTKFLRDQLVLSSGKLTDAFNAILRSNPCIGGANVALITMRAVVNFVSVFVGDSLSQVKVPLTQHSNFLCPVGMPDYGAATQAWLTNAISEETRNCWTRACGMRDDLWSICAEAQRSRLGPDQLVRLLYRGELTPAEFAARVRELGYIRESDPVELAELGRQIPGPADLVRFMLRDVADPQIVERFGLDASFADKFQGNLVKQARAQGLDPETMRDYWRAHWSIPSPTQLYEMFHRLRGLEPGDPLRVSLEDVRAALEQADILPFWIDKLLEVSFRPLRLVDTRRAYFQGSIDRQEVRRVYQATGYSDRDAEILTRFQGREKVDAFIRGPWGKKYIQGAVSGQQLQRKAIAQGFTGEEMVSIRDGLAELLEAQRKAKCTGNIRRRQLRGELDKISAATELQNLGLDGDQAIQLAETWACEKATRGKEFQGSQLCKLYAEGLIDGPEFVRRLEKAGWERDDAVRLYTLCSRDLERKRRAEEIRILRQQEAEAEKAARKAQQAAKGLETAAKQQEAERDRLAKLNQARNRVLTDAGAAWAKRFGDDLSDSIGRARLTYRSIADTTTIPKDAIIRAVYTAAKSPSVESADQWITEALAIAQGQVETTTSPGMPK